MLTVLLNYKQVRRLNSRVLRGDPSFNSELLKAAQPDFEPKPKPERRPDTCVTRLRPPRTPSLLLLPRSISSSPSSPRAPAGVTSLLVPSTRAGRYPLPLSFFVPHPSLSPRVLACLGIPLSARGFDAGEASGAAASAIPPVLYPIRVDLAVDFSA